MRDANLTLAVAQAPTTTAISEHVITGKAYQLVANGKPMYLVVRVTTGFTTSSNTLTVTAEMDSAVGLDSTPTVLGSSPAIPTSSLTKAGTQFVVALSPGYQVATDVYIGCRFTCSTTLATGVVDAWITPDVETVPFGIGL
jgi:hypothetical protein